MKIKLAVSMLAALAQDSRLAIFRLLVRAGSQGVPAGTIAKRLKLAAPTCSFHLKEMLNAGLIIRERNGRSLVYAVNASAMTALLNYLLENCCAEDLASNADG